MRKLLSILSVILVMAAMVFTPAYAASVPPQEFPGNDSNPNDFTPPEGCIHHEIPNSGNTGVHQIRFNEQGQVDPNGSLVFTVTVGQVQGEDFTKVLSWESNFPIGSVIVKDGDAFNLYAYGTEVRADTDLVAPDIPAGHPADVSHVSVVICPGDFPPPTEPTEPTEPTQPTEPTKPTEPTIKPTKPVKPCPPRGKGVISGIVVVIFSLLILAFFLLGTLVGSMFLCPKRRWVKCKCKKDDCHKKDDCDHCKPKKRY